MNDLHDLLIWVQERWFSRWYWKTIRTCDRASNNVNSFDRVLTTLQEVRDLIPQVEHPLELNWNSFGIRLIWDSSSTALYHKPEWQWTSALMTVWNLGSSHWLIILLDSPTAEFQLQVDNPRNSVDNNPCLISINFVILNNLGPSDNIIEADFLFYPSGLGVNATAPGNGGDISTVYPDGSWTMQYMVCDPIIRFP